MYECFAVIWDPYAASDSIPVILHPESAVVQPDDLHSDRKTDPRTAVMPCIEPIKQMRQMIRWNLLSVIMDQDHHLFWLALASDLHLCPVVINCIHKQIGEGTSKLFLIADCSCSRIYAVDPDVTGFLFCKRLCNTDQGTTLSDGAIRYLPARGEGVE